jgi:WD40 repeat protein
VAFSPDGTRALTGSEDGTARLWDLNQPVTEDADRIVLWAEVLTGLELDDYDVVHVLKAARWHERRQHLEVLKRQSIP